MAKIFNKRALSVIIIFSNVTVTLYNLLLNNYSINANAISYVLREMNWEQAAKDGCAANFSQCGSKKLFGRLPNRLHKKKNVWSTINIRKPVTKRKRLTEALMFYKEKNNSFYMEVKPVSYNNAKKKKLDIQQLDNYTNWHGEEQDVTYLKGWS